MASRAKNQVQYDSSLLVDNLSKIRLLYQSENLGTDEVLGAEDDENNFSG